MMIMMACFENETGHVVMGDDDDNIGDDEERDAAEVDNECDIDVEDILRHIEPEVLFGSAKDIENFETLNNAPKNHVDEGCEAEWTVLHLTLYILMLKARFC